MVFVGKYSEQELVAGKDKIDVAKAQEETGLKYTETKMVKEKGKIYLKIWVCGPDEFTFGFSKQANKEINKLAKEFAKEGVII